MNIIARIRTDFPTKFGIPRQSGIVDTKARIVFEPEYCSADAVRGLEGFSHIWLIWEFSEAKRQQWSPTVRPPRLGGNVRMGVFATRSPFRPNPLGLSSLKLEKVELDTPDGPILHVSGADLMDGTPIFDIKPYVPYADCHPDALGGFAPAAPEMKLYVNFPHELRSKMPSDKACTLADVLAQDPRPSYQEDESRVYGFSFAGFEVKFRVEGQTLTVLELTAAQ